MKKFFLAILSVTLLSLTSTAQNVNIPDANFKAELLANAVLNANVDGEISVAEAAAYAGPLDVGNKGIADLTGIEAFTSLTTLYVYQNLLTSVDISANVALTEFDCDNNAVTSLDISANTALVNLYCSHNALTSLNLRNGNNLNFTTFYAIDNPNLLCIEVDSVAWATANWTVANGNIDAAASFSLDCGPFVTIPDSSFRVNLLANAAINTINDGKISVAEAAAFSGTLSLINKGIHDLTGIEAFTALTNLNCNNNSLTNLNLSANTALTNLQCANNDLDSLNVSNNTALTNLNCAGNLLTSLDISANTALTFFQCTSNNIDSLDVSNNTALTNLICNFNSLTSLDVSANTALTSLQCSKNSLTNLDVSGNTLLRTLNCSFNPLDSVGVSNNAALTSLTCTDISLTSLDVSNNPALLTLNCNNNSLSSLNVSANVALTSLSCSNNLLTGLDLSANTALQGLVYSNNSIPNLDMSNNLALTTLTCNNNNIDSLNVSAHTALLGLSCNRNPIKRLNLSNNPLLEVLLCSANLLTSLDVSGNTRLASLYCDSNSLTSLNVRNGNNTNFSFLYAKANPDLRCIEVDDVAWSTANWTVANGSIDSTASFSLDCNSTVGIAEPEQKFVVFPNPATSSLTIEQRLTSGNSPQSFTFLNAQGQLVLSGVLDKQTSTLDISAFNKGIYFLRLTEGEQVANRKIVIE